MLKVKFLAGAFFAAGIMAAAAPAQAIECEGNFQIQRNGNMIATPYCEDQYLAIVAREYGMRVSGRQIRQNYGKKRQACRLAGYDNRVRNTCAPLLNNNRRGRCGFAPC
jgi:hypothetical protein